MQAWSIPKVQTIEEMLRADPELEAIQFRSDLDVPGFLCEEIVGYPRSYRALSLI